MKKWKPKIGDIYYYIKGLSELVVRARQFDNCSVCQDCIKMGNCFKTKAEALSKAREIKSILKK